MQTARHLVGAFVELTSGMEHSQNHLKGALMLLLVHIHGDTAAIVDHGDGVVFVDGHFDVGTEACQGLVDRVVDHLINQMVQTLYTYISDVHGRTLTHCFQPFQHLDIAGAVFFFVLLI